MVCKSLVQLPYEWLLNKYTVDIICVCVCDLSVITHIYSKVVWFYEAAVCPVCFRGAVLVSGPCQSLSWPTTEYHRHSGCVLSYRYSLHTLQLSRKHLHHQGTTITTARVYSCCHLLSTLYACSVSKVDLVLWVKSSYWFCWYHCNYWHCYSRCIVLLEDN